MEVRMRSSVLALWGSVALLLPEVAVAGVCYASNELNLASCVDAAVDGDEVELASGEYLLLSPLELTQGITLRAKTAGGAVLKYRGTLDASQVFLRKETYLLDNAYLIDVRSPRSAVRLQGLVFEPPIGRGVVIGRALRVQGDAIVEDCRLAPYDLDGDGVDEPSLVVNNTEAVVDPTGGIFALVEAGSTLVVQGSQISDIDAPYVAGAAIVARGADAVVQLVGPTWIQRNRAAYGIVAADGGARIDVLTDTEGVGPTLSANHADAGGALFANRGSLIDVSAGWFTENTATRGTGAATSSGGHIAVFDGSEVSVSAGQFVGGDATFGGSIASYDSIVRIHGGAFVSGTARLGGHVLVMASGGSADLSLFEMTGGKISGGVAELSKAEQAVNAAAPDGEIVYVPFGGGAFVYGATALITGGELGGNTATETYGAGGALYLDQTIASLKGPLRFSGNQAGRGGAIYGYAADIAVDGTTFVDNGGVDTLAGGAIQSDWGDVEIIGATFSGNRGDSGGAVTCFGELSCSVSDTSFTGNAASWGGAVYSHALSTTLADSTFTDNVASQLGGHVYAVAGQIDATTSIVGTMSISGGRFEAGVAGHGGAVEAAGVASDVRDVSFDTNAATGGDASVGYGGAWVQKDAPLALTRVSFLDNTADYGGAVYTLDAESTTVVQSVFTDNAAAAGGALILSGSGGGQLVRNVFRRNLAEVGAALYVSGPADHTADGQLVVANNVVDGEGTTTQAAIGIAEKRAVLHHNDLVRHDGLLVALDAADVELHHNLFGYSQGVEVLAAFSETANVTHHHNAWWRAGRPDRSPIQQGGAERAVGEGAVLEDPHLRGAPGGRLAAPPNALSALHPRPLSPLLLSGYPAEAGDDHIGIFGGMFQFIDDWNDVDGDGAYKIFDCNDDSDAIGDRLVQFVDGDGDGVGGEPWAGDDCVLVSGNVLVDGDCDDADPDVIDCIATPEGVAFYGSSCASTSTPAGGALALSLLAMLGAVARRRRPLRTGR